MVKTVRLADLCRVFRSKNASPFLTTIDLFFDSLEKYRLVRDSGVLDPTVIAGIYRIPREHVVGIHSHDEALGIKVTLVKPGGIASGDPANADVFGAQQYVPLLDLPVTVA